MLVMCDETIANICLEFYFVHSTLHWIVLSVSNAQFMHVRHISAVSNSIQLIKYDSNLTSELAATFLPHVRLVLLHYLTEM